MSDQGMDPERERRRKEARRKRRERERRINMIKRLIFFGCLLILLGICATLLLKNLKKDKGSGNDAETAEENAETNEAEETQIDGSLAKLLEEADTLALGYDYDGAIEKLKTWSDQTDQSVANAIASYTTQRDSCVPVDVSTVPHIFFHSLINDDRAFFVTDTVPEGRVIANNAAMATVDEFNHVINDMYAAGYVMIRLDDMVIRNDDGTFSKNTSLKLPPGKKAFIMSEDDLSYYHAYGENGEQGYADRLVIDENGKVKCEYVDPNGNKLIGDYDMVPLIDTFIEQHPDFAYKGARPTIALTGYNGIFGYITNTYYKDGGDMENLGQSQKNWLAAHPEYDYETDCAKAREIAQALKAEGWTFASHTYGHLDANVQPVETLMRDHERWKLCVGDIIGETDKIIFAFGADIGGAGSYTMDNPKYAYYKSEGFDFFCNCDGTWGWTQIASDYVRTGRFAIDGFTLYQAMTPEGGSHERCSYNYEQLGVKDIASFFNKNRTTPIESE